MKVNKPYQVCALILVLALLMPSSVNAQTDSGDVFLRFDTVPNILLVEINSTETLEDGSIEVTFSLGNPMLTYYLPFSISGTAAEIEPISSGGAIWDFFGLLPPTSLTGSVIRIINGQQVQTLTYRARFTSPDQFLQVEARVFGFKSIFFNSIQAAANAFAGAKAPSSEQLARILQGLEWEQRIATIAANTECLSDDPLPLAAGYDCAMAALDVFKESGAFRDLLVGVLQEIGMEGVTRQSIDEFILFREWLEKFESVSDLVAVGALRAWRGGNFTTYNRYTLTPVFPSGAPGTSTDTAPKQDNIIVIPDIQTPDGSGLLVTTTVIVPGGDPPLDLIFVVDTTGSMRDDIAAVKAQTTALVAQIAADVADYRIGLVTYQDHPVPPYGAKGDAPYTVNLPLTADSGAVIDQIQGITLGYGGDLPESVYSGLMKAIEQAWRDGAQKAIILLGDAPPHDPEPFTGYTLDDVLAAAYAVDPANIYPILIQDNPDTAAAFAALAKGSSGQVIPAGDAQDVVAAILQALQLIKEARTETVVTFPPPPPMPLCSDIGGLQNTFVRAAVPGSAADSAPVFCRPLVQNRQYVFTGSAAQIGNADALNLGIIHAVDVYTYDPTGATHAFFNTQIDVCLQGAGDLYLLGASQSPRVLTPVQTAFVTADGFTCGRLGQQGTFMLVGGAASSTSEASTVSSDCTVTTTANLNLRSEPNTSSTILTVLPINTTVPSDGKAQGWFHILAPVGTGWVSANYVTTSAACAP